MESNILDSVESIYIYKNGAKSAIVWAKSSKDNSLSPLLYISKPKNIGNDDFQFLLSRLEVKIIR
jgi:hypothetical protein